MLDQLSGRASRLHRGGRRFDPVIKHLQEKTMLVRCKVCNKELRSTSKVQCCGCSNMMKVVDDTVGAMDLSQVVIVEGVKDNKKPDTLSREDRVWQENRRKRKVRRLDFDVRQDAYLGLHR